MRRSLFSPLARRLVFCTITLLISGIASQSFAKSAFIPIDFGAAYEPQQLNGLLIDSADKDARYAMVDVATRDALLDSHFPELSLPNVSDLERLFAEGNDAYYNGDFEKAAETLSGALDEASNRLVALTLRPGFAETVYQGGLALIQIYAYGLQQQDQAEVVMERLVRMFPSQTPDEEQFPPDLIEAYSKYLPSAATGKTLNVHVGTGCVVRLNGKDSPTGDVSISVLAGEYGIAEVCNDQTTRAYVVPINDDTTVDFHGDFANGYTYPINLLLDARGVDAEAQRLAAMLATIGRRISATHVVGAGLVPGGGDTPDGYRMILVEVATGKLLREFSVSPAGVATPEGMADALNALWTGEDFQVISDIGAGSAALSMTTIGFITAGVGAAIVIGGGIAGLTAKQANDDFFTCNEDPTCRLTSDDEDSLNERYRYSLVADVLYGVGGAVLIGGTVLVILDQMNSGSRAESETAATGDWHLSAAPTPDGGVVGFHLLW